MKVFALLILSLLLCFGSCEKQEMKTPDFVTTKQQLSAAFDEREGFVRADEDFVSTNFGSPEYLQDSAVYLSDQGEIGVFALSDPRHTTAMQAIIKDYLATERQAVVSLAELYPADELSARLARFDRARIGTVGSTVYYYMLDSDVTGVAERLFIK